MHRAHWPTKGQQATHQGPEVPGIFPGLGNAYKTLPWEGLGGNWYTQKVPGYHKNHSPRKKSGQTSWGTDPSTRSYFSGPPKGPGPSCARMWAWGSKKWGRGQKYQSCVLKNHAESIGRCPKQSDMLQVMAPNHFGGGESKSGGGDTLPWTPERAQSCSFKWN